MPDADDAPADAADARAATRGGREPGPGTLVLAGTPLGNPADASPRLAQLLASADLVAAEDTRRLRRLLSDMGVVRTGPVVSYYEDVERERLPRLLEVLAAGGTVALVTDAGMPSVSDPGYRAARAALDAGHARHVPARALGRDDGAGRVRAALRPVLLRGVHPPQVGRAPRPAGRARRRAADPGVLRVPAAAGRDPGRHGGRRSAPSARRRSAASCPRPTRRSCAAASASSPSGRRPVCAARSRSWSRAPRRRTGGDTDAAGLAARVAALEAQGIPRKEAIALVASSTGAPKRSVFDAVVAHKSREQ